MKDYGLWIKDYGLRIMDQGLWNKDYGLRIKDYGLRIMDLDRCRSGDEENKFKFCRLPPTNPNFEPFGRRIANELKSQI